jgi:predicted ribosomally synthesized peptide with nif11-like leader
METMKIFIEKLKTDEGLLNKVIELKKADDREGILNVMRENGVTEEDIKKGLEYEKSFESTESDELDDSDLEMVAGGKGCQDIKSQGNHHFCIIAHFSQDKACSFGHAWVD